MQTVLPLICILLPFLTGLLLYLLPLRSFRKLAVYMMLSVCATSVLVWMLIRSADGTPMTLISFSRYLVLTLRTDKLGKFFLGILATLWPLTALYACSYMEKKEHLKMFFSFFLLAYSVTIGIAEAGNLFTMYCFYELLTLTTVPLVIQPMTKEAVRAARTYFIYSLGGAAFGFVAMVFLLLNGGDGLFQMGGLLTGTDMNPNIVSLFYVIGFLGFGVKAAVFPVHGWLPKVSVAPTPVTALLHAVAVVKAGAFAVIRLTYYSFGTELLLGSWGQIAAEMIAAFTIFFGASMAVKESHWKRRMVYSTVANLSYILFGAALMTDAGLCGSLMHMAAHACIKILAFFCVGAVLHRTGRSSIYELDGLGRKMPVTFACFTAAALSLTGIPPLNGFVSKWTLLTAAAEAGTPWAYAGAGALLAAALLTAIYMLTTVRRAWFPDKSFLPDSVEDVREADWKMLLPMLILATGILAFGIFAEPVYSAAMQIAGGVGI